MEHTIINHSHFKNYTVIPNSILQATDIPLYAMAVLCHLLSMPNGWNVSVAKLAERFGEKECRIVRALNDLITLGYCKRVPFRSGGKLRGQQYFITDVRNDFSDPEIFSSQEKSECRNSPTTEISDPQKKQGSEENIYNNNNNNINISRENKEAQSTDEPLCLFKNSRFAEFEKFSEQFTGDDYAGVNLRHYYEAVKNWSAAKRVKRNDWIATARGFMLRDFNEGKLVRVQASPGDVLSEGAKEYLRMGMEDELWPS